MLHAVKQKLDFMTIAITVGWMMARNVVVITVVMEVRLLVQEQFDLARHQ